MADISVIIPTCDRPDMLQRAIASAAGQTEVTPEIIVVNDGQDLSAMLINTYTSTGNQIRIINNRHPYSGVSSARNLGARHAGCPLIAFLDDDDYWDPRFLSVMKTMHETQDIHMSAAAFWNDVEGVIKPGKTPPKTINQYEFMERNPGITGSNFLIRKDFFDQMRGFDEALPTSNDKDFAIRFVKHSGKYSQTSLRLVYFVHHQEGRLTNVNRRKLKGTLRFYNKYKKEMPQSLQRKIRSKLYLRFWEYESGKEDGRPVAAFVRFVPKAFWNDPVTAARFVRKKWLHPSPADRRCNVSE